MLPLIVTSSTTYRRPRVIVKRTVSSPGASSRAYARRRHDSRAREVVLDRAARVFEQVLVRRCLGADRHEPIALGFGQRVAGERHRHVRAAVDRDAHDGAAVDEIDAVCRARFVEAARAQRRLVFLELRIDRCGIVRLPDGDTTAGEAGCDRRDLSASTSMSRMSARGPASISSIIDARSGLWVISMRGVIIGCA